MKIKEMNYIKQKIIFQKKGREEYYKHVDRAKIKTDYWSYIIGNRIYAFQHGLFPTTNKINLKPISDKWMTGNK